MWIYYHFLLIFSTRNVMGIFFKELRHTLLCFMIYDTLSSFFLGWLTTRFHYLHITSPAKSKLQNRNTQYFYLQIIKRVCVRTQLLMFELTRLDFTHQLMVPNSIIVIGFFFLIVLTSQDLWFVYYIKKFVNKKTFRHGIDGDVIFFLHFFVCFCSMFVYT